MFADSLRISLFQSMASFMMGLFMSDTFLKMFRKPDHHGEALKALFTSICSVMPGSKKFLAETPETKAGMQVEDHISEFSVLSTCWERIEKVVKCVDFAWCLGVTTGFGSPASAADVLSITGYRGRDTLEITLQDRAPFSLSLAQLDSSSHQTGDDLCTQMDFFVPSPVR